MKYSTFLFFTTTILLTGCNTDKVKDLIEGEFVDYAKPLKEKTSDPSDPARTLPPNPAGCPQWEKDVLNKITESIRLPKGCKYDRVSLLIENQSDITLDCNGAELNGLNKEFRQAVNVPYSVDDAPVSIGIRVLSHETVSSQNITVKNCTIKNYITGIAVLTILSEESHADLKNKINVEAMENHLRENSVGNVILDNNTIHYSHTNGVYIGRYITGLTVDKTSIKYTSGAGLYLESGTQENTIKNSVFSENGHSLYQRGKRARRRILAKDAREGIAIDSASLNTIQNNTFAKNAGGGVFIYKNCYEHHTSASQLPRYQSADNNLITGNSFSDQKKGVWIASRQSKDLKSFNCGDPRIASDEVSYGPKKETIYLYEDFAKNNIVRTNTFTNVSNGIVVEDDNSNIDGNTFSGSSEFDIQIGTKYRTNELSKPVTNTTIKNNKFQSTASKHIRLTHSSVNTNIKGNIPANTNN